MKNKIQEITTLLKEWKKKEACEIYNTFTDEEKAEMQKENSYKSVNGHYYSWFNLFVLSITQEPWTFWTFKQWLENWRCVKKGWKWVWMIVPMIAKWKEDEKVTFF